MGEKCGGVTNQRKSTAHTTDGFLPRVAKMEKALEEMKTKIAGGPGFDGHNSQPPPELILNAHTHRVPFKSMAPTSTAGTTTPGSSWLTGLSQNEQWHYENGNTVHTPRLGRVGDPKSGRFGRGDHS